MKTVLLLFLFACTCSFAGMMDESLGAFDYTWQEFYTFPPVNPPLWLFGCATTTVSGCGTATSCETIGQACSVATKRALWHADAYCQQLNHSGPEICTLSAGSANCLSIQQNKTVFACNDGVAWHCTVWCSAGCNLVGSFDASVPF